MPLWKNTQHSFVAGQLDTHIMGRQDLDKYFKGATKLKNFLVKRQGCISKRRGTDLTADLDGLLGYKPDGVTKIEPRAMRLVPVVNGDDGRYLILSNGLCFVASREGVLTADGKHVRKIAPYVSEDAYGRKQAMVDEDLRHNTDTPVDVIRQTSPGNYDITRYATLADAVNAARDGDTVRLHANITLNSEVRFTSTTWHEKETGNAANVTYNPDTDKYTVTSYGGRNFESQNTYSSDYVHEFSCAYNLMNVTRNWTFSDGNDWSIGWISRGNTWTITREIEEGGETRTVTMTAYANLSATDITFKDGETTVVAHCDWSFAGPDYDPTKTYTVSMWNSIWRVSDGEHNYDGPKLDPYLASFDVVSKTITFERDRKRIDLDFYGYQIYVLSPGRLIMEQQAVETRFISGREGAKFSIDATYGAFVSGNGFRCGSVILDGDIQYEKHGQGGYVFEVHCCPSFIVNRGTFIDKGKLVKLLHLSNSNVTINGGTFIGDATNGELIAVHREVGFSASLVVNGGYFRCSRENMIFTFATDFYYTATFPVEIRGGRFEAANEQCYFELVATPANRETYGAKIIRGEFKHPAIFVYYPYPGAVLPLSEVAWTGSAANDEQPNAAGFYGIRLADEGDYTYDGLNGRDIYRVAIPYKDEDLDNLCIRQSGDTLFVAHRDYPPGKFTFKESGRVVYEEIKFDHTSLKPPQILSAEMTGQDPVETTFPDGFDSALKTEAKALGTVTDAGMNSNSASGNDGSSSSATTYQATAVNKDETSGVKTTHVLVKSVTSSKTIEREVRYVDGQPTGYTDHAVTTSGTAQNNAKASSVMTMRTVRYVATYVKDGMESRPSAPVAVEYDMPWANNAVVNIAVGKGLNESEPDYYNIYKDNGNGYGLIGTVSTNSMSIGAAGAVVDTYNVFMGNREDGPEIVCAADYEERHGWAIGDIARQICGASTVRFSSSVNRDIGLIATGAWGQPTKGIVADFPKGTAFRRIEVGLDFRVYDPVIKTAYQIVSGALIKCDVTWTDSDGVKRTTTVNGSVKTSGLHPTGGIHHWDSWIAVHIPNQCYDDWMHMSWRNFTTPDGRTVRGFPVAGADAGEWSNEYLRTATFDLSNLNKLASISKVKIYNPGNVGYLDFEEYATVIHSLRFFAGEETEGGQFQDDYINPDMTITPPDDTKEAHFSSPGERPGCVGLHQQRLVFASSKDSPTTVWMSRIADLYDFTPHESIREDDALELTLAATEFPNLNHLVDGRDLMLFGDGGEWLIAPISGNALTYKTASAKLQSMIGSDRKLQPLQLADETLFGERGGTCLRTINYNYASDSYQSRDLSVLSQSIFRANPIVSMAYKQHPDSIVECVLKDGRIATLVYMPEQELMAWSVQELGGGWKARQIVTPKCIVAGTTEMMLLVEKDGAYQLWKVRNDEDELAAAKQVVLDGLHIEDADGYVNGGDGESVVEIGNGKVAVGHPIEAEFVSVRPEPEKGATAQMEIKNATEAEIRVIDASTFDVKPYNMRDGWGRVSLPVARTGGTVALCESDVKKLLTGSNNRDGRIHVRHVEPWPITILSISNTYQIEYENQEAGGGEE